jgi:hypothetical protein
VSLQSAIGSLATAGVLLAAEVVNDIGGILSEWGRNVIIAGAMLVAWRVIRAAETGAVDRYKQTAEEADTKLKGEREAWKAERETLHQEILELRREVNRLREELHAIQMR